MSKILKYEITFFDYWHLSSGLSAGALHDSSVVKDENNLPYVPGKTIKGLLREVASDALVEKYFGMANEKDSDDSKMGVAYFSNATLKSDVAQNIIDQKLQSHLYDIVASTKIDITSGIAEDDSLREIEVVVPLTLEGEIRDISDEDVEGMQKLLKLIKRMGLNRNRGLGRCEMKERT